MNSMADDEILSSPFTLQLQSNTIEMSNDFLSQILMQKKDIRMVKSSKLSRTQQASAKEGNETLAIQSDQRCFDIEVEERRKKG